MEAIMIEMTTEQLERFRDCFQENQKMEIAPTDEQLEQYLKVQISALVYDVEVRQQGGTPEGWSF